MSPRLAVKEAPRAPDANRPSEAAQRAELRRVPDEATLRLIWARQLLQTDRLVDSHGRHLQVIYPGRGPLAVGPDFQGALLALEDGTLLRGDVEVHLRPGAWWAHGHYENAAYNRTILHVVLRDDGAPAGRRLDGEIVPTLAIGGCLSGRTLSPGAAAAMPPVGSEPCLEDAGAVLAHVEWAGTERFLAKAARFEAELVVYPVDHALLRGVLVALGYSANKEACRLLADRLPWDALAVADFVEARALLFGAAGLLPSQRGLVGLECRWPGRGEAEIAALESAWSACVRRDGLTPLAATVWRFGARPDSSPWRRLAGGARLVSGWAARSPAEALVESLFDLRGSPRGLAERYRVRDDDPYWSRHADFGRCLVGARPWLIGWPRAVEIVVNVALPFCYALGRHLDQPELSAAALIAFRAFPAGPWNRLSLQMAAQLFGPAGRRLTATAARQQGLLHLFHQWCWERRCEACPAGERRRMAARVAPTLPATSQ